MYTWMWMAGKAFPPPFSQSLDPRPFSTCFDFCPGESDNIWDPISIQLLSLSPFHSHPVSQSTSVVAAAAATWNSIEKKRKTQWAECWNRRVRRAQRRYFSAFFSQIGGRVNCRWRRRQCACAVAAHPLRWESPPFRTKAQNAELLSLPSLSLELSRANISSLPRATADTEESR